MTSLESHSSQLILVSVMQGIRVAFTDPHTGRLDILKSSGFPALLKFVDEFGIQADLNKTAQ